MRKAKFNKNLHFDEMNNTLTYNIPALIYVFAVLLVVTGFWNLFSELTARPTLSAATVSVALVMLFSIIISNGYMICAVFMISMLSSVHYLLFAETIAYPIIVWATLIYETIAMVWIGLIVFWFRSFSRIDYTIQDRHTLVVLKRMNRQGMWELPRVAVVALFLKLTFRSMQPEHFAKDLLPIFKRQGKFIYDLLIKKKARYIIELGTSHGFSTIHLAAAAKENQGKVITTELLPNKAQLATENFKQAHVEKYIELREGDALETLKNVPSGIDFLLLDGWKEGYLPVLKLLEPKLRKGTLIYIDNARYKSVRPCLEYVINSDRYSIVSHKDDWGRSALSKFIG